MHNSDSQGLPILEESKVKRSDDSNEVEAITDGSKQSEFGESDAQAKIRHRMLLWIP